MSSDISIKIDYLRNRGNPSEVFQAMALYIEAYRDLGQIITNSVGYESDFILMLDDIETGSIVGKLSILSDKFRNKIENLVVGGGYSLLESLVVDTETESDVEVLAVNMESNISKSDLTSDPFIDRQNLASTLAKFSEANAKLLPNEKVELISPYLDDKVTNINVDWRFTGNPKTMFLGKTEAFSTTDKLYVKIAVNEGQSVWTFKSPALERSFTARIVNKEWLSRYQQGLVMPIGPKDMIEADITYDIYTPPAGKGHKEIRNAKILKINQIYRNNEHQHELSNF